MTTKAQLNIVSHEMQAERNRPEPRNTVSVGNLRSHCGSSHWTFYRSSYSGYFLSAWSE